MRLFVALILLPLSSSVTLKHVETDIKTKSKVELSPLLITCGLNDIAVIAAPVVDTDALYHLHKPNSDVIKLKLPRRTDYVPKDAMEYDNMVVKYINPDVKTVYPIRNSRVISTRTHEDDVVGAAESKMYGNEFMIGPFLEEDHGNWVLSIYFKDLDDQWIEMFQVITVEIVENVPLVPKRPLLKAGATFHLRFEYPIKHLESCELTAPDSSYDRFFDRSKIDLDRCGYVVRNITSEDAGMWRIIGIGKVMYEGYVNLHVISDLKTKPHIRHKQDSVHKKEAVII